MTVDDIIERTYRRYLHPAFDQPVSSTVTLVQPVGGLQLTVAPFDTVEYSDAIAPGTIVEVGYELMTVTGVSGTDPIVLDVVRGAYGTPISEHAPGDRVVVAPQFPRHDLWLAAQDEIEGLHPDLWVVKNLTWTQPPYTVPDDVIELVDVRIIDPSGNAWPARSAWIRPTSDGLGRYVDFGGTLSNVSPEVTVSAAPIRPTNPMDELSLLNVLDRWADIVAMGIAIQHVTGQNVSDLRADYLTEIMETQVTEGVQPRDIEQALRRARALKLNEERRRIRANTPTYTRMRTPLGT